MFGWLFGRTKKDDSETCTLTVSMDKNGDIFTYVDVDPDAKVETINNFSKLLLLICTNRFTTNIKKSIENQSKDEEQYQVLEVCINRYEDLRGDIENTPVISPLSALSGDSK